MRFSTLLVLFLLSFSFLSQAQFTAGNLAVFRADGTTSNTSFSIIELNPATAGQSSPMSTVAINGTTGTDALRTSGSASSTGYLANSNDGTLLCFTAHNSTTSGSTNANTITARGVGTLNAAGTFSLATTYTGGSGNQTRCATTLNNINWFIADQGGLYTNSATSASPSGNYRSVRTFGGTAYIFTASTSLPPVSTVSATSGGTVTGLPGLANGVTSNQDFYMVSSGSNGSAFDILYVLAATSGTAGTITKYSLVSGSWVSNGSYTTSFGGFGLAAAKSGSSIYLYVTSGTGASTNNNVIRLTDDNGYNTPINITTANNVILYTTATGTILKGIAFSPVASTAPAVIPSPSSVNFGNVLSGVNSSPQAITLTASNLSPASGSLTITAPNTDFQVSNDGTTWGASTTVTYSSNGASIGNFQVRFTPQSSGAKSGNVTVTDGGLSAAVNVGVSGTGDNSLSLAFSSSTTSYLNPPYVSGTINDVADPAQQTGIIVTVKENGVDIPAANYMLTAASSNTTVVPNAKVAITTADGQATVKISPDAVGYSTITLTLTRGIDTKTLVINYAASQSPTVTWTNYWHTGIADASAAIALDDDYMIIANDETNLLYVYDRKHAGLPVTTFDFNQSNILSLTDGAPNYKEVDVEAGVRSIATAGKMYWLGSMSNSSSNNNKPNRDRLFAVTVSGTGAVTSFANAGYYGNLRQQLITWGDAKGYNFSTAAADGKNPKTIDGFNVEGMVFGPDNTTLYIGFRAPLVPTANRTKAVIAPIQSFETWFNNGAPAGNPVIGAPIELDLGGRGIRDIIRLSSGNYIIIAGSYNETAMGMVYLWTGNAVDAPVQVPTLDISTLNAEGVMQINVSGTMMADRLQVISDNGDNVFYGDAILAKDLAQDNFRKYSSDIIISTAGSVLPVTFESFTANKQGKAVLLNWKNAQSDLVERFEILRSVNGSDFTAIGSVAGTVSQTNYSFTDNAIPGANKLYYRIRAIEHSGITTLTAVRFVDFSSLLPLITIYPNPVSNNRFSLVVNQAGFKTVTVFGSNGALFRQLTFNDAVTDISTNGWPTGWYLLNIKTADGTSVTYKLIVP